ncbi:cyclic nucleotide-binding domain-containing protein [bacterium]|nr:cyclic nucleotide-binding domain-containing protein [bacterium]
MNTSNLAAHSKDILKAPKGTVLMREGEIGKSAFLVLEGRLLVERNIHGENVIIAEIMPRDIVGELAILDNEPRSATVTAIEDSLLIEFDKHRIKSIIRRSPDIAEVILKLLSHKLRTTHFVIHRASNLTQPVCWIKICTLLKIIQKAESDPSCLYSSFLENLQLLGDIPFHRLRLVMDRLAEASLITSEGKQITSVNKNRLESFYLQLFEESANEPFSYTSSAKQYQALEVFRFYIKPQEPGQEWVDIPRKYLIDMLVNSNLWSGLGIQLQLQRADTLINSLLRLGFFSESPVKTGELRIFFEKLSTMDKPEEAIRIFETVRRVLMAPLPAEDAQSTPVTREGAQ